MDIIRILIAESVFLVAEGLRHSLSSDKSIFVLGRTVNAEQTMTTLSRMQADVLVVNPKDFSLEVLNDIHRIYPHLRLIFCLHRPVESIIALKDLATGFFETGSSLEEIVTAVKLGFRGEFYAASSLNTQMREDEELEANNSPLSDREVEIIKLVAEGLTNKKIAERLFLSAHTVMTHRKNIMNKLVVSNTAGMIMYAVKEGLIKV